MPWRPVKKCNACSEIAEQGSAYCSFHKAQRDQSQDRTRERADKRGYNNQWHKVEVMKKKRNPICEDCEREGLTKPTDMVHHLDENPRHNEMSNLRSLCWFHHAKYHGNARG